MNLREEPTRMPMAAVVVCCRVVVVATHDIVRLAVVRCAPPRRPAVRHSPSFLSGNLFLQSKEPKRRCRVCTRGPGCGWGLGLRVCAAGSPLATPQDAGTPVLGFAVA